jgi:outer membrane lipoprotein-sorting protein
MKPRLNQALLLLALLTSVCPVLGAGTNSVVAAWLGAQTNIHSWAADFVQTRALKSLTQPLTATGHVWFAAPSRFRWELGNPPQTIAVRAPADLYVIYPLLKRAERYPLSGETGAWRDALALLEAGFPRSQAELDSQYDILGQTMSGQVCELTLQPKSATARRMMPQIKIGFDTANSSLRWTELEFADGSTMRNDFKNPVLNPSINEEQFTFQAPPDYKVVTPLKK